MEKSRKTLRKLFEFKISSKYDLILVSKKRN